MSMLVVHLVRQHNGPQPLERFLDSYSVHQAETEHELLLALKGFGSRVEANASLEAAHSRGVDARHMLLPDHGLDLTAYARVVAEVDADRYCFVNSFSRVLVSGWLRLLASALDQPGVSLAGSTGSWASLRDFRRYHVGLSSGYDGVFADPERTRLGFLELTRLRRPSKRDHGRLAFKAAAVAELIRDRGRFDRFPAPHVRTNAFVASRELMLSLGSPRIRRKADAYRLESGRASLTSRVLNGGDRAVIVASDGAIHDPDVWDRSGTFWQGKQEQLIIADNQTDGYEHAPPELRRLLSALAWGQEVVRPEPGLA